MLGIDEVTASNGDVIVSLSLSNQIASVKFSPVLKTAPLQQKEEEELHHPQ